MIPITEEIQAVSVGLFRCRVEAVAPDGKALRGEGFGGTCEIAKLNAYEKLAINAINTLTRPHAP